MPSSSGTFSSRNRAVGQAQRESERETSADPFIPAPQDQTSHKPFLSFCDAFAGWHLFEHLYVHAGGEGRKKKKKKQEDADEWQSRCLSSDWVWRWGASAVSLLYISPYMGFITRQLVSHWRFLQLNLNNENLISGPKLMRHVFSIDSI